MGRSTGYYDGLDAEQLRGLDHRQRHRDQPAGEPARSACGRWTSASGVVREVTDQEILDAKAKVGAGGLGCEPASAPPASPARSGSARKASSPPSERVVCILTGHQLKDPTATVAYHSTDQEKFDEGARAAAASAAPASPTAPVEVPNDLDEIIRTIALYSESHREPRPGRVTVPGACDHCPGGFLQLPRCDRSRRVVGWLADLKSIQSVVASRPGGVGAPVVVYPREGVIRPWCLPFSAVGIHGATGRMGTRLIQLIQADPALRLAAALDRADHPQPRRGRRHAGRGRGAGGAAVAGCSTARSTS